MVMVDVHENSTPFCASHRLEFLSMKKHNPLFRNHLASVIVSMFFNTVLILLLLFLIKFEAEPKEEGVAIRVQEVTEESVESVVEPEELVEEPEPDTMENVEAFEDAMADMMSEINQETQQQQTDALLVDPIQSPILLAGVTGMVSMEPGDLSGGRIGKATQFMGQTAKGSRFAFVIDYSKSMSKTQLAVMKHELYTAVDTVGEQGLVSLLFFSGPVWRPDQDAKGVEEHWAGSNGKGWYLKDGAPGPNPRWLLPHRKNLAALLRMIHQTPTTYGTDWYPPMKLALSMNPRPDVLFFMTDGSCPKNSVDRTLELVESLPPGSVQINTVALGVAEEKVPGLKAIAELTGGTFKHFDEATLKKQAETLPDAPDSFRDFDLAYLSDAEVQSFMHRATTQGAIPPPQLEKEFEVEFRID